jgi:hypothetical protein
MAAPVEQSGYSAGMLDLQARADRFVPALRRTLANIEGATPLGCHQMKAKPLIAA